MDFLRMNVDAVRLHQEVFVLASLPLLVYFFYHFRHVSGRFNAYFHLSLFPCITLCAFSLHQILARHPLETRNYIANRLLLIDSIVLAVQLYLHPEYHEYFDHL